MPDAMNYLPAISLLLAAGTFFSRAAGSPLDEKLTTGIGQVQSVFNLPASPQEGRDPFFPESTRALEIPQANAHSVEISSLKVPGISGTPGRLFAIINNHTFGVGEEGDVKTAAGIVHLHCLEIQSSSVVVEINGQTHRLNVGSQ